MPAKKEIDLKRFKELLDKGVSTKELCKIFDITESSVARAKLKCGYLTKKFKILTKKIPYEDLYNLFANKKMSTYEIAKHYNETRNTIIELMNLYNISQKERKLNISYEELYKDYKEDKMTYEQISKKYNISVHEVIENIHKYNLKSNRFDGYISKEELYKLYIIENIRANDIAKLFGCSISRINGYLAEYKIKKDPEQYHKLAKETCLKKYGVENAGGTKEAQAKIDKTKKENNTYGKSKVEEKIYILLKDKFKTVERQYKSKKYPFPSDFYIPEKDLYIEYQGYWTHGKQSHTIYGPFEKNKPLHQKMLANWQQQLNEGHKAYKTAIQVWTVSDPLKRQTAKDNGLNWLEFWTFDEFIKWYNQQ